MDHDDSLKSVVGNFITPGINPNAKILYSLLEQGYIFDIATEIIHEGVNGKGEYINPKLIGLSILTYTGKKTNSYITKDDELRYALETLENIDISDTPTYMGVSLDKFSREELIKLMVKMHQETVGYDK